MHIFQKTWVTRLFLIIVPILLLSIFSSFLGDTGTAFAARVISPHSPPLIQGAGSIHVPSPSRLGSLRPHGGAFGGGCAKNVFISSCISIDGYNVVRPDAYLNKAGCGVAVYLYEDSSYVSAFFYNGCYFPGSHFLGPIVDSATGNLYQTYASVSSNNVGQYAGQWSPIQYT